MATTALEATPARSKPPWHLWAVGILGLLWNAYGAFDYYMSKTRGDAYLQSVGMTGEQITYFNAMPSWMTVVWAVGVWGALLGSVLLLARNRYAAQVFIASLVAYVLSVIYQRLIAPMPGAEATAMLVMQVVIFVGCVFFAWYALRARSRGWIR